MSEIRGPVLVTGAGGFIGRRVVAALVESGQSVVAMALADEALPAHWDQRIQVVRGDVRDRAAVDAAVSGVGTVIHLAALVGMGGTYEDHWSVTAEGSRNIYEAAAQHGARVVVTTSICAYGDRIAADLCSEESPRGAYQGAYGRAKQAQEDIAHEVREATGLEVVIVRPSNVYGVGSGPWVEGILAMIEADLLAVLDEGSGNAGLLHVDNLADALLLLAGNADAVGRTYNVCDGLDVSWARYFDDLAAMTGKAPLPRTPQAALREAALANEDLAACGDPVDPTILPLEALNLIGSDNRFDTGRIRSIGWKPRIDYEQGLRLIREDLAGRQQP